MSTVVAEAKVARADIQEQQLLMAEPRVLSPAEVLAVAGGPEISNGDQ